MSTDFESLVNECREAMGHGTKIEGPIVFLHERGASIVESIRVIREIYGLPLDGAKAIVAANPVWIDVVTRGDVLHQELETALQDESRSSDE